MHESHYGRGKLDERVEIAKKLLECSIEIDMVMKGTGLIRAEVEKIKEGLSRCER